MANRDTHIRYLLTLEEHGIYAGQEDIAPRFIALELKALGIAEIISSDVSEYPNRCIRNPIIKGD